MWHFGSQVKVTFWFWLMYPPPPRNWNWTKHECYRTKSFWKRSSSTFYDLPPPISSTIIWFYAWTGNWWISISNGYGYMDSNPFPHPSAAQKNEMLVFGLRSTSDDQPGWFMDSNPIHHPSPAKKMKCSFLDYVQFLMISRAGQWTQTPTATSLQPKNEIIIFGLCSTSDDRLDWSMDSNPICYPSPAKKMKCSFLDCIQILMISLAGQWIQTPSTTHLQLKKMKCSFLDYVQLLMIGWPGQWTRTPSTTLLQTKKWNAHFWITFNLWWSAGLVRWTQTPFATPLQPKKWRSVRLVDELESHLPPLFNQKNDMLIFGLRSTSYDWPGWSMDSNPICHLSPAKKMKCLFLDYFQFLVISRAGRWTRTPSTTPLQPKNEMLIFGLRSTSDDQLGWSMDSNPICHPSPNKKKWYAHFCITFNFWWLARLINRLEPHLQPVCNQKYEILVFGLHSTSDDQPGWSKDLNPICNLFPTKKMKCSFLYYVQLLVISLAGRWTQTPSVTPLQPKKWNACFGIMFNFWWSAGLVDGLKPICHPSPAKKMKCSFLYYIQLLMIGRASHWTQTPSTSPLKPKKMKCLFLDYI